MVMNYKQSEWANAVWQRGCLGMGSLLMGLWLVATPVALAKPPLNLSTGQETVAQLKESGVRYAQLGFYTLAIESYRGAIALEDRSQLLPSQWDADVPINLGLIYLQQGSLLPARDAFARAVEADPTSFKARYQLGVAEMQLGNYDVAKSELSALATASTANPETKKHLDMLLASIEAVAPTRLEAPEAPPVGSEASKVSSPVPAKIDNTAAQTTDPTASEETLPPPSKLQQLKEKDSRN
ncbi:MAG: tetratricopeptide repeat protein [Cyanobacteriota bacterium]|nr:tetratricopeptide repeat protein [Cyanobacteriota bacterium]